MTDSVKALIAAGADLEAVDGMGTTALELAVENAHQSVVNAIIESIEYVAKESEEAGVEPPEELEGFADDEGLPTGSGNDQGNLSSDVHRTR